MKYLIEKLTSKKFVGWLGACAFLYLGKVSEDTWLWITITYMGVEGALNVLANFKKKENV